MPPAGAVYLNHAGTSWPKPRVVAESVDAFWSSEPSHWSELFRSSHQAIADFFHVPRSRLLLTPGCTSALAIAIADHDWQPGDRVLTSRYEHHALYRPLVKLQEQGVKIVELPATSHQPVDLDSLDTELRKGRVRMVALTAACNVTGRLSPIGQVIERAHRYDALDLIDGAQIAGWWDLDLTELGADLFTFAGHKGPQAPWGIGGLYIAPHVSMNSPLAACEIGPADSGSPCTSMPGFCDAGSVNLSSLAGMAAATRWLGSPEQAGRLSTARDLASTLTESLRTIPGVTIIDDVASDQKMPTVAITVESQDHTDVARDWQQQGLTVSAGFQCAPRAHQSLGTADTGVIRLSVGPASCPSDFRHAQQIAENTLGRLSRS